MTKGDATINGLPCSFDTVTGIGLNCAWKRINGKDYWYEGGKRQGYDPNNAAYRGKEIYRTPPSNGWYWLDNVQQGCKKPSARMSIRNPAAANGCGMMPTADDQRLEHQCRRYLLLRSHHRCHGQRYNYH